MAAIVAVPILYLAWTYTWVGTYATTCTMGDAKSLVGALVSSWMFHLASFLLLRFNNLGLVGLALSLPLVPLMVRQADWGLRLFVITNINNQSACSLIKGEDYGEAMGGWFEQLFGPYYLLVSVASLIAIAYAHWRYWQERRQADKRS